VKSQNSQPILGNGQTFSSRLREERIRAQPKAVKFAEVSGLDNTLLSALENGKQHIRADHLALLAAAGIDILYVVTGHRGGEKLALRESALLSQFRSLDDIGQCTVLLTAAQMVSAAGQHFTPRDVIQAMVDDLTMSAQTGAGPEVLDPRTGAAGYLAGLHDQQREYKGEE
jgi:transcriptional regulator with XRE-family HTH domain